MNLALAVLASLAIAYAVAIRVLPLATRRKLRHALTYGTAALATVVALVPLALLLGYLVREGWPGLDAALFTRTQRPLGEPGGGLLHAILGSFVIVGIATAFGAPIGVLAGVYLAEYGRGAFAATVRFLADVLTGLPSIIAGILGYALIVVRTGSFSGWAGAFALAILIVPVVTRVTEESMRLVPNALREASFGLGAGSFRTVWHVVLPAARGGILTGVILAVARVGGETAPLLFTAAGQSQINLDPGRAMAALPLSIYLNAGQPFESSRQIALSGALLLVVWILIVNLGVRLLARRRHA